MPMKWLVLPAFWLLYWGICFICTGGDKKNLAGLRSYPDEVQAAVRERLGNKVPAAKSVPSILTGNLLLFTVVFSIIGTALRSFLSFDGYASASWYFLPLGEGLGLFDLVVIDLHAKLAPGDIHDQREPLLVARVAEYRIVGLFHPRVILAGVVRLKNVVRQFFSVHNALTPRPALRIAA